MRPAGRREKTSRWASGTAFLAGVVAGAVIAAAAIILVQSSSPVVQAAAAVPLTAAVAGTVAVLVLSSRTHAAPDADAEQALALQTPDQAGAEASAEQEASQPEAVPDPARPAPDPLAASTAPDLPPEPSTPDPPSSADTPSLPQPSDKHRDADADDVGAPPSSDPDVDIPAKLVDAWDRYRIDGDGFFTAPGLQAQIDELGIDASVRDGGDVNAPGDILVVEVASSSSDCFFVVPSFTKSPSAAPQWFEDASGGARQVRTRTILSLAEGKWTASSFEVAKKGVIG